MNDTQDQQHDSQPIPPLPTLKSRKKKRMIAVIVGACVLVVFLAILGAMYYIGLNSKKTDSQSVTKINNLRIGLVGEKTDISYPQELISAGWLEMTTQVYEGLVRYEGVKKIAPLLAESWSNPDDTTWIFKLKKDVSFHNGRVMKAQDVKKSIDLAIESKDTTYQSFISTISSVEALDDSTVQITTKEPDPILLNKLPYLYIVDTQTLDKPQDGRPSGTGAFKFKSVTSSSSDKLELAAFDKYHGDKSTVNQLTFINYSDFDKALNAAKKGDFDVTYDLLGSDVEALNAKYLYTEKANATGYIGFNYGKQQSPIQNEKVRQALSLAIDRDQIIKDEGFTAELAYQFVPRNITGYDPSIKVVEKPDIQRAKELLAEAGYPDGVELTFTYTNGYSSIQGLSDQFKKAGITLKLIEVGSVEEILDSISKQQNDMYMIAFSSSLTDGSEFFLNITNQDGFRDDEYQRLIDASSNELNAAKRLDYLQQLSKMTVDKSLVVPIYEREYIYALKRPYNITQDVSGSIRGVYYSKVTLKQ